MNFKLTISALLVGSALLAAIPGCAADASDAGGEDTASEEELNASAAGLVGAYRELSDLFMSSPPMFEGLAFQSNGDFFADVDTGVRCYVGEPCATHVRLTGRFTATDKYVDLAPKAGEQAHVYHGRYGYRLTPTGTLVLTRTGSDGTYWSTEVKKAPSFCAEPTDCDGQSIMHPGCSGYWTCNVSRSCAYKCGTPTPNSAIWPTDRTELVAESAGYTEPPPPGATCARGQSKYTLDVASRKLTWEQCVWGPPQHLKTGSRVITTAELATVDTAMKAVKVKDTDYCGGDKPLLEMHVTSASQETKWFADNFYSCKGGSHVYVENIDGVFGALYNLARN